MASSTEGPLPSFYSQQGLRISVSTKTPPKPQLYKFSISCSSNDDLLIRAKRL